MWNQPYVISILQHHRKAQIAITGQCSSLSHVRFDLRCSRSVSILHRSAPHQRKGASFTSASLQVAPAQRGLCARNAAHIRSLTSTTATGSINLSSTTSNMNRKKHAHTAQAAATEADQPELNATFIVAPDVSNDHGAVPVHESSLHERIS